MNNPEDIKYDTPALEPILKNTYSVIVYQEQVMDIVRALAGFTAGQSDTIRKAMGKKVESILEEYKPLFIKGCVSNGISEDTAIEIWCKMSDFAKYAFNKSHAAAYSVITFVCAWIKYYYPSVYMASVLNVYADNNEKLRGYVSCTKSMGINIIPPDINLSGDTFLTNGTDILFGLKGLKGLKKLTKVIIEERKNGKFESVQDFVSRTYPLKVAKLAYESLVYSGAFDQFNHSRKALIECSDKLMEAGKKIVSNIKKESENQLSFFDVIGVQPNTICLDIPETKEYSDREKLESELDIAGIYISAHPLDNYSKKLSDIGVSEIAFIKDDNDSVVEGKYTFAGTITDVKEFITKKGDKMATFTLADTGSNIKCTVFPNDYETAKEYINNPKSLVVVKGIVENNDTYGTQLLVNTIIDIDKVPDNTAYSKVFVKVDDIESESHNLDKILCIHKGNIPVTVQSNGKLYTMNTSVTPTSSLFMSLSNKFGYENVKFS